MQEHVSWMGHERAVLFTGVQDLDWKVVRERDRLRDWKVNSGDNETRDETQWRLANTISNDL